MKCHVEQDWTRNALKVWFYERHADGRSLLVFDGRDTLRWEELAENVARPEPSLVMPMDAVELLMAEAGNFLPPSAATDRHLNDAIAVRDRLLDKVAPKQ